MSAARAHRSATAQPPLTGRERSGLLKQPRRTEKARFVTLFQRHDRQGKVHARRTPCPISLKYDEELFPQPPPHLAAFILPSELTAICLSLEVVMPAWRTIGAASRLSG